MKYYSTAEAMRQTNLTGLRLRSIAQKAGIDSSFGFPISFVEEILLEQIEYISFREYAAIPRGKYYDGIGNKRNKVLDVLELNNYFGVKLIDPKDILIGIESDIVFFL